MIVLPLLFSGLASLSLASPLTELTSPLSLFDRRDYTTTCGTSGSISCRNTTAAPNLCCFEHPGGLIVLPQFWDTKPANGPADSWTIHGLWPDLCTGGYDEFCDSSRDYPASSLSAMLRDQGAHRAL
ncbi:hypothetical protein BKA70DRAFT_1227984 [Coprinopsis sp. MPI-PUGE-AT-0042]|nr:hypothetical protein BKA70DRAFT_1227984 [Coprinopsis sp. MPI-PUGE-AT-0042]